MPISVTGLCSMQDSRLHSVARHGGIGKGEALFCVYT